jgi:hypothetical protein
MKLTTLFLAFLILLLATAALGQTPNPMCNIRSAMGAYGYNCSGVAPNPFDNFAVEPFAAYGYVFGDGRGQWHGYGKVSFNGAIAPWTHNTRPGAPGTVNPDCTGAVTYEVTVGGQPVPDAHFEYVIVDSGREVKGFPVDAGYAVSCQLILEK